MVSVSHNIANQNRPSQDPDQITHLWANGMEGDPGAFSRNNPPPPRRNWGQVVGYETTMEPERYPSPLEDGFRADWHDVSATVGEYAAHPARWMGQDQIADRLEAEAARDRATEVELWNRHKYDPNAAMAFSVANNTREIASAANGLRRVHQFYRWLQKR